MIFHPQRILLENWRIIRTQQRPTFVTQSDKRVFRILERKFVEIPVEKEVGPHPKIESSICRNPARWQCRPEPELALSRESEREISIVETLVHHNRHKKDEDSSNRASFGGSPANPTPTNRKRDGNKIRTFRETRLVFPPLAVSIRESTQFLLLSLLGLDCRLLAHPHKRLMSYFRLLSSSPSFIPHDYLKQSLNIVIGIYSL